MRLLLGADANVPHSYDASTITFIASKCDDLSCKVSEVYAVYWHSLLKPLVRKSSMRSNFTTTQN
jgi:hypothetical protein